METTVAVADQSHTGEVRRAVAELARVHALPEADLARATLAATEVATHLVKSGRGGALAASWFEEGGAAGIQIVATDTGPGFANFADASGDGQSTGGGLGAVMRAADEFDMYSVEGQGSAFLVRIAAGRRAPKPAPGTLLLGSRSLPKAGQHECGDTWAARRAGRWERVCVIDGLGHGPLAAAASREAARVLHACPASDTPLDIVHKAHAALKVTRGAVMAVAAIDAAAGVISFAGVGNIAGIVFGAGKAQHLMSIEGIVGYNLRAVRQQDYPWTADSTLVMNSDGLSTRWSLARSPGLLQHHPALVAAVLHRDFGRDTDDATVVVARITR